MAWAPSDPNATYVVIDASFNADAANGQCLQSATLRSATFDGSSLFVDMLEPYAYGFVVFGVVFPGTVGTFVDDQFEENVQFPLTGTILRTRLDERCLAPTGTLTVTRFEMGADQNIRALDATLVQRCFERPPLVAKVHVNNPAA